MRRLLRIGRLAIYIEPRNFWSKTAPNAVNDYPATTLVIKWGRR